MTTVRQIITRAGRVTQEVSEGQPALVPYRASVVGLTAFNAMMAEMRGVQIGQKLARDWSASEGDAALAGGLYKVGVLVPAEPWNGDRFGVIGAQTVTAVDDTIEELTAVTTTESTSWYYREDLGNWLKEQDLGLDDVSPLSTECDESLATMLAARMWLEQFGELTQTLSALNANGRAKIGQLYRNRTSVSVDGPLLRGLAHCRARL